MFQITFSNTNILQEKNEGEKKDIFHTNFTYFSLVHA